MTRDSSYRLQHYQVLGLRFPYRRQRNTGVESYESSVVVYRKGKQVDTRELPRAMDPGRIEGTRVPINLHRPTRIHGRQLYRHPRDGS